MRFLVGVRYNIERFKVMNLINFWRISNHALYHLKVALQLDSRNLKKWNLKPGCIHVEGKELFMLGRSNSLETLLNHDDVLDRLASSENRTEKTSILADLIKKTNAQELKWIVMIILKASRKGSYD